MDRDVRIIKNNLKNMSFKNVQNKIAKKGEYSEKTAGAILAGASRNASAKVKKANPKLLKVKGKTRKAPFLKRFQDEVM